MSLPHGSRFQSFARAQPVRSPHDAQVLGVGWRVVVTCPSGASDRVTLMDEDGTNAVASVADGVEVEILAWRPRRAGGTRYRVVATKGGVEGWLGAASLKPRQRPSAPAAQPVAAKVVERPARRKRGTR
jgi:hypothetical protein